MKQLLPDLYASEPERLPFAPSLQIRSFLLRRAPGNLLVYASGTLDSDAQAIEDLGGIATQYLNHRHEARFGCDSVARTFGASVHCHEAELDVVAEVCAGAQTFARRELLADDFEVIPTPGHTPGATAFLWDSGQHRCLFTGDTIYFRDGAWIAAVLPTSDRDAYLESLELIEGLDFDVLVPWATSAGHACHEVTTKADVRHRIHMILDRVRRGGDH